MWRIFNLTSLKESSNEKSILLVNSCLVFPYICICHTNNFKIFDLFILRAVQHCPANLNNNSIWALKILKWEKNKAQHKKEEAQKGTEVSDKRRVISKEEQSRRIAFRFLAKCLEISGFVSMLVNFPPFTLLVRLSRFKLRDWRIPKPNFHFL